MAYRLEKNNEDQEIVWDGFENGIAPSPHKGIANMQGVDISTETKEVMNSFSRIQQSQNAFTGMTFTQTNASHMSISGGTPVNSTPVPGSWVHVVSSTIANFTAGSDYFVYSYSAGIVQVSTAYDPTGANIVSTLGAGTATVQATFNMAGGIQAATEFYTDASHVAQNRYYILDSNGRLWVYDTALTSLWKWFLPYTTIITSTPEGLGVLNGTVFVFGDNRIYTVSTVQLPTGPSLFSFATAMTNLTGSLNPHFAYTGHDNTLYYTDGMFVGSIFPNTSVDPDSTNLPNVQSYAQWNTVTNATTGNITDLLSGSVPATQTYGSTARIPAFFFAGPGGTLPATLTEGTKYYIDYTPGLSTSGHFEVYAASSGGSALDISTGRVSPTYFNTFWTQSSDGQDTLTFSQEALTLPTFETSTAIAELGTQLVIGTRSNALYVWDRITPLAGNIVFLPENNTSYLLVVNNNVFIFAGSQGNIYITNGSTASLAITVPAYCTGLIEPYFIWGGAMYLRGRVWFSIQDQTASHTGNCGGIWSFIPQQNFYIGQDTGLSLRMDNRPADGTFNGKSTILLPAQDQNARGPQYWDTRTSSITSPTYTINFSDTLPTIASIIETDIVPTGTILQKKTFTQLEFKLAAPTDTNATETVALAWRQNLTDSFTAAPTMITEVTNGFISGYCPVNFQKGQWLQLQVTMTPDQISTTGFNRLFELRAR